MALLDSHALIWALEGSDKLSPAAAQALEDGIPLVTRDPNIARYQVQVIW